MILYEGLNEGCRNCIKRKLRKHEGLLAPLPLPVVPGSFSSDVASSVISLRNQRASEYRQTNTSHEGARTIELSGNRSGHRHIGCYFRILPPLEGTGEGVGRFARGKENGLWRSVNPAAFSRGNYVVCLSTRTV
jgi:hypothetical protein